MSQLLRLYRRLGIQQRVMLHVIVGLVLMFGAFAFLGLASVQQATQLVYDERLTRAYTIASVLEDDTAHVASDVQAERADLLSTDPTRRADAADRLASHLVSTDSYRFFRVAGVSVLDRAGTFLASAGSDALSPANAGAILAETDSLAAGDYRLAPGSDARVSFASIVTRIGEPADPASVVVVVRTLAVNSTRDFMPGDELGPDAPQLPARLVDPDAKYHLEVVSPDGLTVLGIGSDEHSGMLSHHAPVIQALDGSRQALTLLHRPGPGDEFEPHVMAVVPLAHSNFYLVLEQAVDVALALPMQLQQRFVLLIGAGFLITLLVAWFTTWRVVGPIQALTEAARGMAQGDLESPIRVHFQDDELGRLSDSLESMRRQLRTAYQDLEGANRVLESQVRERTARLGELLTKLISAQEEERSRLARELHDETAQTLGALCIALDRARDGLDQSRPREAEQIAEAKAIATRLLEETRRLILDLRPSALDDLGLAPAIRWYAETHLEELGVVSTVRVDHPSTRLPKHVELSLFRVTQEAVNNIGKHAHARRAKIRLAFDPTAARVLVSDDGRGFDAEKALATGTPVRSVGLLGMQERVRLLNGRLRIRSKPGKGTSVSIVIPLPEGTT